MYQIVKRPVVTEKNSNRAALLNEYAFEVAFRANKKEIKEAIEKIFGVSVVRVNTMVTRKDAKRLGRQMGARTLWKKALVKLKEGDKFDFVAN